MGIIVRLPCSCTQNLDAYGIWVAGWRLDDRASTLMPVACCKEGRMGVWMEGWMTDTVRYVI